MSIFTKITSLGVGELCTGLGNLATDIRSAITGELSPDDKANLENKLLEMELTAKQLSLETQKLQSNIIIAEAQGESLIQRTWRPYLMVLFGIIIANAQLIYPYLRLIWSSAPELSLPPEMWEVLKIGVGGYVGGRSVEKVAKIWKEKV